MSLVLYHHPYSRAANVLWMLEELGLEAELRYVDFATKAQKEPEFLALNPMGKLPVLVDKGAVITEVAAIGLYLADRYSLGNLAPSLSDLTRSQYLRWSLFSPSVIEPALAAKGGGFEYRPSAVGWGTYEAVIATLNHALSSGPYLLGAHFTMADIILGGTLRYMLRFKMLEPIPRFEEYVARLSARPQSQRAEARNAAIAQERGLAT
jgi:glutathione S-transferase